MVSPCRHHQQQQQQRHHRCPRIAPCLRAHGWLPSFELLLILGTRMSTTRKVRAESEERCSQSPRTALLHAGHAPMQAVVSTQQRTSRCAALCALPLAFRCRGPDALCMFASTRHNHMPCKVDTPLITAHNAGPQVARGSRLQQQEWVPQSSHLSDIATSRHAFLDSSQRQLIMLSTQDMRMRGLVWTSDQPVSSSSTTTFMSPTTRGTPSSVHRCHGGACSVDTGTDGIECVTVGGVCQHQRRRVTTISTRHITP